MSFASLAHNGSRTSRRAAGAALAAGAAFALALLLPAAPDLGAADPAGATTAPAASAAPATPGPSARNTIIDMSARTLYAKGQVEGLAFDAQGGKIVLDDWALAEDDSDGVGAPYPKETLSGAAQVKKELMLDSAGAKEARLLIYHDVEKIWETEPYEARVNVSVNAHSFEATLRYGWNSIPVEPSFLVQGKNEITLATPAGAKPAILPITDRASMLMAAPWRAAGPERSFKSLDGGKTWSPKLGKAGDVRGEYLIRLHLERYAPMGTYVSPVMDLCDVDRKQAVKPMASVRSVIAHIRQESPAGTSATCLIRTGQTPAFEPAAWEDWKPLADGARRGVRGRYFQVKLSLATDDPLRAPSLAGLGLDVEADAPASSGAPTASAGAGADPGTGTGRLQVLECKAFPVVRSSLPFEYESLGLPALKQLRQDYRLDEAVKGAANQFERVQRLNHWVSSQWKWHAPDDYPNWDALEILKKKPGGESKGGFCGQYGIAMMQCCLAMGIQARYVFAGLPGIVGGHEMIEFWSDDDGKWVIMDTNMDRYYLDPNTRVAMNAMEIHQSILRYYFEGDKIGDADHNKSNFDRLGLDGFLAQGPQARHGGNDAGPNWFDPKKAHLVWGHPHLMPRNNFLSKSQPMPKSHGFGMSWSWNGYYNWHDPQTPREEIFTHYTDRLSDFYWNLNQVDLVVEETPEPGVLAVTAETFTPDLQTMLVSMGSAAGGGDWAPTAPRFLWRLKPGENKLQVKVRNAAGNEGKPSVVRVAWSEK
jgi:hypothetical protein